MLRWLQENLGTLLLSFLLAVTVWVAAVSQADPILEQDFSQPIAINYVGLADEMLLLGQPPETATVTLRAPESLWRELALEDIHIEADLSELGTGSYRITLVPRIDLQPARVTGIDPEVVNLTIELSASKMVDVNIVTYDQPALGFQAEEPIADPNQVQVVGPASMVDQVHELRAEISLTNRRESIDQQVQLVPLDKDGNEVTGVQITTEQVRVVVQIKLGDFYRLVSVIPIIEGRDTLEELGYYRVTNITYTPREVIVSSSDREALDALPVFVETTPLDISEQTENIERRLPLNLPEGVYLVGEQSVLVRVTIEPVLTTITVTREIEIQGLGSELFVVTSPGTVDIILNGPSATLNALQPEDVRVVIDLRDFGIGNYQLEPQVLVLPTDIVFEAPIPSIIDVEVTSTPPSTATPTP
jgi:YbbR domain-containing protein